MGDSVAKRLLIETLECEIASLKTKLGAAEYAMNTVADFVRPRIPKDQNPEQATSFLAWIGMIIRLEERGDRAIARAEAAERENKALREFVHRWTWAKEGSGTSDAERLDVIKHHPLIASLEPSP